MPSVRKLRAGRVANGDAATFVGQLGTIFWDEDTGELRLSDGVTPGGSHLPVVLASSTVAGGVKLGPGVVLNNDGQIIIDSTGLDFNFGDFLSTTAANGSATLQSKNTNQDIAIVSNGTGVINVVGDFHVHQPSEYDPENPDTDGAVFTVKGDGQVQMKIPLSDVTTGALEIVGNDSGEFIPPNQTGVILHVTGNSSLVSRNYFDANQNYSLIVGRRYNGTAASPTKVLSGELFFRIAGQASGQATTEPATFQTFGPCQIDWVATEDQKPNNQGGELRFRATPNGTSSQAGAIVVATINATTGLTATQLRGKLYRDVRDAGTIAAGGTLTIDFSSDAIVHCVWGDGLNIAYQNYVVGRVVKVMAVKSAGTGTDSINLDGVTAGQVSSGNTTVSATAGATVFMEFISTTTTVGGVFIKL